MISVCGPTASGKSDLSDDIADLLTESTDSRVSTVVVDSMQVYKQIPIISNQPRRRSAELVGLVNVDKEWNVAKHQEASRTIIDSFNSSACVLDAGTGMYLNAILLDIQLAPKVDARTRSRAEKFVATSGESDNTRRNIRETELRISGADARKSVWQADLRYCTDLIYLRPPGERLTQAIDKRTRKIMEFAGPEVMNLRESFGGVSGINAQVKSAIGVKEIDSYIAGNTSFEQAASDITRRTRALAKRQLTWFDKLARTLKGRPNARVIEVTDSNGLGEYMSVLSSQ